VLKGINSLLCAAPFHVPSFWWGRSPPELEKSQEGEGKIAFGKQNSNCGTQEKRRRFFLGGEGEFKMGWAYRGHTSLPEGAHS